MSPIYMNLLEVNSLLYVFKIDGFDLKLFVQSSPKVTLVIDDWGLMLYDEFSGRRWKAGDLLQGWVVRQLLNNVRGRLPQNLTRLDVLEVGCGTGIMAREVAKQGVFNYVGVEPNSTLAALVRSTAGDCIVHEDRLPNLSNKFKAKFDLVIAAHVVEHATSGYEARAWILDLIECAKDTGTIVIVCPHTPDYKMRFWDIDWSHGFPTSINNLRQIATDLGVVVKRSGIMRLGSLNPIISSFGFMIGRMIPVRLLNLLGRATFGRELGTGLASALFWGVAVIELQPAMRVE